MLFSDRYLYMYMSELPKHDILYDIPIIFEILIQLQCNKLNMPANMYLVNYLSGFVSYEK